MPQVPVLNVSAATRAASQRLDALVAQHHQPFGMPQQQQQHPEMPPPRDNQPDTQDTDAHHHPHHPSAAEPRETVLNESVPEIPPIERDGDASDHTHETHASYVYPSGLRVQYSPHQSATPAPQPSLSTAPQGRTPVERLTAPSTSQRRALERTEGLSRIASALSSAEKALQDLTFDLEDTDDEDLRPRHRRSVRQRRGSSRRRKHGHSRDGSDDDGVYGRKVEGFSEDSDRSDYHSQLSDDDDSDIDLDQLYENLGVVKPKHGRDSSRHRSSGRGHRRHSSSDSASSQDDRRKKSRHGKSHRSPSHKRNGRSRDRDDTGRRRRHSREHRGRHRSRKHDHGSDSDDSRFSSYSEARHNKPRVDMSIFKSTWHKHVPPSSNASSRQLTKPHRRSHNRGSRQKNRQQIQVRKSGYNTDDSQVGGCFRIAMSLISNIFNRFAPPRAGQHSQQWIRNRQLQSGASMLPALGSRSQHLCSHATVSIMYHRD